MTRYLLIALAAVSKVALAEAPSRFRASIDNFSRHTYTLELRDDGKLVYQDATPETTPQPIAIAPTPEQWRDFRRALDAIGVWAWHDSYMRTEVVFDGSGWSL